MHGKREEIRGVLFDAGNTLVRVRGSVGEVYARVARRHGVPVAGAELEDAFRRAFARRKGSFVPAVSRPHSEERERRWWRDLVVEVFRTSGVWPRLEPVFEAFFAELYDAFAGAAPWEVFPDVRPCLDALATRGLPLGVVSNWDSRLHGVLEGLGLRDAFRFVLTSAEFGAEKPHPSIFLEAAARLDLPPPQILHVGDLPRDDLAGAQAAGLRATLVARDGRPPSDFPDGGWIRDLSEVVGLVTG